MSATHAYTHEPNPRMAGCALQPLEIPSDVVAQIRDVIFDADSSREPPTDVAQWYRERSSEADQGKRAVAWKTGKPFKPDNLFFRTVDTGRLLPMALAHFRVQLYAIQSHWDFVETQKTKDQFAGGTLAALLHGLLLLRNVHDYGGADMPIIIVDWQTPIIEAALDYWVEASKNEWSETERAKQFCQVASMHPGLNPCLYQVDRCVRSLLRGNDPDVGYVAPVIAFYQFHNNGKCFPLFTRASHAFPGLESFPTTCGALQCDEPDCGYWNMKAARSLHSPSSMVGKPNRQDDRTVCNLWGCEVQHTERTKLQQCVKCKEVLYCSRTHQSLDWHVHKSVCEKKTSPP